jgi:o-succinylbenzoate synthase
VTDLRRHVLRIGARRVVLVEGPHGWGECSPPLDDYPCTPAAAMAAALEAAEHPWPATVRDVVPVNALVNDPTFDPAALASFGCVKIKVGRRDPRSDLSLVSAVRDALGPSVALRVDANGAWDEETAERVLERMVPYDIELAEQPVATIDALARLRRRVRIKLAADECIRSVEDATRLRHLDAADAVVLKVQPLGGMRSALRIAEAAGVAAIVSSMMETSVGIAVGLHLAAALPELPYACGLATAELLEADVVHDRLVPQNGCMPVRRVVPDHDLLTALVVGDEPAPYGAPS